MQMYGPINDFKECGFSRRASCPTSSTSRSLMLDSTRRASCPSSSTTKMLGHRRTSSSTSESRPPRHPNRRISRYGELGNSINSLDLDDYTNEKFPAEILARIESTELNQVLPNEDIRTELYWVLSNEDFHSLLGVEEVNDDIVLEESYFQCFYVWSKISPFSCLYNSDALQTHDEKGRSYLGSKGSPWGGQLLMARVSEALQGFAVDCSQSWRSNSLAGNTTGMFRLMSLYVSRGFIICYYYYYYYY